MIMSALSYKFLVASLLCSLINCSPLFIWSNFKLPSHFALEAIPDLSSTYNILIFNPYKFSHKDISFSKEGDEWIEYLKKKLSDESKSKYIGDTCGKESLKPIKDMYKKINYEDLNIDLKEKKIYCIDLPPIHDIKANFTTIIESILKPLDDGDVKYIAMLTDIMDEGDRIESELSNAIHKRSVRAIGDGPVNSTEPTGHFINGTCIFIYLKNATFNVGRQKRPRIVATFPLENTNIQILEQPDCTNQKLQQIRFGFSNLPQGLTQFNLHFAFVKNRWNYWKLSNVTSKFMIQTPDNKLSNDNAAFHIPKEVGTYTNWSYVCDDMGMDERPKPRDRNYTILYFDDFQIQAFGVHNNSFGRPSDCTGFFSPALWMGLFSSGVLISVLAFGLTVLLSTKSMDRFDNPKMATALNLAGSGD